MSLLEVFMSTDVKSTINPSEISGSQNIPGTNLKEVIELSAKFPVPFPTTTAKCDVLKEKVSDEVLERNIRSAYPIIHEKILVLYTNFLKHKRRYGSKIEKKLYQDMTVIDLVDRFLKKRAMCFVGVMDAWKLRDGQEGLGKWETIGTSKETHPLILKDYLSYDEIKLSAFLSISSYTYYLNDGNRQNKGVLEEDRTKVEDEGIIVGLIGPRLVKNNIMEYQDILIEKEQNTGSNGYGGTFIPTMISLYTAFYDKINMTYKQFLKSKHCGDSESFTRLQRDIYFDNLTYSKRLALSLDTFFLEANARAKDAGKFAYVHVVGIGLGVWLVSLHQIEIFARTIIDRIESLGPYLHNVSDVNLAYIQTTSCGDYKHGDKIPIQGHPKGGVTIYLTQDQPHTRLTGEHEGKLRVVSFAWDANAFPGNEYWYGSLQSSSDPAAACSTQVTELHNAYINKTVCGGNLHVASKNGVESIDQYLASIRR